MATNPVKMMLNLIVRGKLKVLGWERQAFSPSGGQKSKPGWGGGALTQLMVAISPASKRDIRSY